MNTQAARKLGLEDGDEVTIATPQHRVHGRVVLRKASGPTRC